jgi:hypothetical protein
MSRALSAVVMESISETSAVSVNDFTPKLFTSVATSLTQIAYGTQIFTPSFANAIAIAFPIIHLGI